MWKIIFVMFSLVTLLTACGEEEIQQTEGEFYQPLEYKTEEGIERRGKIPTGKDSYFKRTAEDEFRKSKYGQTNRSHDNDFNNDESIAIMEKVNELKEVTLTQAFTDGEKVFVAVMVNPYDERDQELSDKVRKKAESVTDKPVTVFTNNPQWDRMKDLNSRLKAAQVPDEWESKIRNFFKQNQPDQ